jgi:hypothetical protein
LFGEGFKIPVASGLQDIQVGLMMQSVVPLWRFQTGSTDQDPNASPSGLHSSETGSLNPGPSSSAAEILRLKLPGLTGQLRWTLQVVAAEVNEGACQRSNSPSGFTPVSWGRWMELLQLQSLNAVKARLARLEAMGLIEVQLGTRGPWGTNPNSYRLRWASDGRPFTRAFGAVLRGQARQDGMKKQQDPDTPRQRIPDTPGDLSADTLALTEIESIISVLSQSVGQLATELNGLKKLADGLTELIPSYIKILKVNQSVSQSVSVNAFNNKEIELIDHHSDEMARATSISSLNLSLKAMLKATDSEPWPEALLLELGRILDPLQVAVIEERSPWSAEGAWAILEAIRMLGRNLGNQPGTLWNALLKQEKGARWLAHASPSASQTRVSSAPGQGSAQKRPTQEPGGALSQRKSDTPPTWKGDVSDGDASRREEIVVDEDEEFRYPGEDDAPETKEAASQPQEEPMARPEDFSPEVKAELRTSIETLRQVTRAAFRSPSANRPGGYDDFSRCWQHVIEVLEPMLPLKVNLPDEYRSVAIRQRSQIKLNVVNAVYQVVS